MSSCRRHWPKWRLPPLTALLLMLAQPSTQLMLNCSGGDLKPVGAGVSQLTLAAAAAPTSCRLSVSAAAGAGRWYLKLEPGSGADGELRVQDGAGINAWGGAAQLGTDVLARLLTQTGDFSLDLTLRTGQLTVQATLVPLSACPPESDGWSMPWSGRCLMVSSATANALSFSDAQRACERVGANLFTTAASDATAWTLSYLFFGDRLRSGFGYWIGARLTAEGDWAYINGSRLLVGSTLPPYKYHCGGSIAACECALYRATQIYRNDCSDRRPYICSAPPGGAPVFYSALDVTCVDCRVTKVTVSSGIKVAESERQMYFYVLGICVFILAAITVSVIACFAHSIRRWQLDAKLAARQPPGYAVGDNPQSFQMQPAVPVNSDPEFEPPVYDTCLEVSVPPTDEVPPAARCDNSPANQHPPAYQHQPANHLSQPMS